MIKNLVTFSCAMLAGRATAQDKKLIVDNIPTSEGGLRFNDQEFYNPVIPDEHEWYTKVINAFNDYMRAYEAKLHQVERTDGILHPLEKLTQLERIKRAKQKVYQELLREYKENMKLHDWYKYENLEKELSNYLSLTNEDVSLHDKTTEIPAYVAKTQDYINAMKEQVDSENIAKNEAKQDSEIYIRSLESYQKLGIAFSIAMQKVEDFANVVQNDTDVDGNIDKKLTDEADKSNKEIYRRYVNLLDEIERNFNTFINKKEEHDKLKQKKEAAKAAEKKAADLDKKIKELRNKLKVAEDIRQEKQRDYRVYVGKVNSEMTRGNAHITLLEAQIADLMTMPMTINRTVPQSQLEKNAGLIGSQLTEIAALQAVIQALKDELNAPWRSMDLGATKLLIENNDVDELQAAVDSARASVKDLQSKYNFEKMRRGLFETTNRKLVSTYEDLQAKISKSDYDIEQLVIQARYLQLILKQSQINDDNHHQAAVVRSEQEKGVF